MYAVYIYTYRSIHLQPIIQTNVFYIILRHTSNTWPLGAPSLGAFRCLGSKTQNRWSNELYISMIKFKYTLYIYVLYMCKELQYIQYIHVYTQMKPAQAKPQSVVDINFQPTSLNMPRHEQEPLFNKENRSRSRSKHWSFSAKCCGFAAGVVPGSSSMTNLVVFGIGGWVKTYKMSSL